MSRIKKENLYISVNGRDEGIFCQTYGNPDGVPVLVVHGGAGYTIDLENMTGFDPQKYKLITWHQRGIGQSQPYRAEENTIETHAQDIQVIKEHLGIDRWHVFSWSFGTLIATLYGLKNPSDCLSFLAYAPYLAGEEDWDVAFREGNLNGQNYMALYGGDTLPEAVSNSYERMKEAYADINEAIFLLYQEDTYMRGVTMTWEEYRESKTDEEWRSKIRDALWDMQIQTEAFNAHDKDWLYEQSKHNLVFNNVPAVFYYGGADPWVAPNSNVSRIYPNATHIVVPGMGHDVCQNGVQKYVSYASKQMSGKPKQSFVLNYD